MKKIVVLITLTFLFQGLVIAQIGNTIPSSRKTNWETAGYQRSPLDNIPNGNSTVNVASPSSNAQTNWQNITTAISTASASSNSGNRVIVQLQAGHYVINQPIIIDQSDKYIILRGQGAGNTFVEMISSSNNSTVFDIKGVEIANTYSITNYNATTKTISLNTYMHNLQVGDLIDIQVPNGSWANDTNDPPESDLLGQVVEVTSIYYASVTLKDDISYIWNLANSESKTPYVNEIIPVQEIGIEDMTIESKTDQNGTLVKFFYVKNSWITDVETYNAVNAHVEVKFSTALEFRRNYIHHAYQYGGGGYGYGITFGRRSAYNLVEDNIFQHLRHSMLVSRGALKNVFGYNYSREAFGVGNTEPGDISLHGNYPSLNLFEGNRVDKIHADSYHGSNGAYNTLFRNFIYEKKILVDDSNNFNIAGNEGKTTLNNSIGTLNKYDNVISHNGWNPADFLTSHLSDISYYHTSKPSFLQNYFWPPIGPSLNLASSPNFPDIPARDRFCSENPSVCEEFIIEGYSDVAVLRKSYSSSPLNRIYGFVSQGSSFGYKTNFSYGGYDFQGITSGDYNGDGIDDISFYRAYGDTDPTPRRVFMYISNGSSFSYETDFTHCCYEFKGISSGDYNGDGKDDIAFFRAGGDGNPELNRVVVYKSNGPTFSYLTTFTYSSYDFKGLTSGDFNGDGIDDIAFYRTYDQNKVYVFKSNGTSFSYMTSFTYGGYDFQGITSGDYNGDGKDDIAFYRAYGDGNPTQNKILIYKSNGSSFSHLTNFTYGSNDFIHITTGDYNGDKLDDIGFIAEGSENQFRIMKSNGSSFSYFTSYTYSSYDFEAITSGRFFNYSQSKISSSEDLIEEKESIEVVKDFEIKNYPNPFNPSTNVVVSIPMQTRLKVEVYNILGQKVSTLFEGKINSGHHNFHFDASSLTSGIYLVRAIHSQGVITQKMLLMK